MSGGGVDSGPAGAVSGGEKSLAQRDLLPVDRSLARVARSPKTSNIF